MRGLPVNCSLRAISYESRLHPVLKLLEGKLRMSFPFLVLDIGTACQREPLPRDWTGCCAVSLEAASAGLCLCWQILLPQGCCTPPPDAAVAVLPS